MIPPPRKSAPASSPFPGRRQTGRHPRCDACPSSNRAGYEYAARARRFPARVSSCFRRAGRGRPPGKASGYRCAWSNVQRPTLNANLVGRDSSRGLSKLREASPYRSRELLHDLERGALAVARSRAGEQRADRLNGLAVAADDPTDVGLAQLHPKDRRLPPDGISESIISSGNSTSWRMTNSRNCFTIAKLSRPCAQAASPRDKSGWEACGTAA